MKTLKKLFILVIISSITFISCDINTGDELPQGTQGIVIPVNLDFQKINSFEVSNGSRFDFGFEGDAATKSLYISYLNRIGLNLERNHVMLKYDIASDSFDKLEYKPWRPVSSSGSKLQSSLPVAGSSAITRLKGVGKMSRPSTSSGVAWKALPLLLWSQGNQLRL